MWDEQEAAETPARRRILALAPISGWTPVRIHVPSSRQLPTDHDHGGGYAPIPEYQSDQSSAFALGRFLVVPRTTTTTRGLRSATAARLPSLRSALRDLAPPRSGRRSS
jgi:hypothetical protein